MDARSMNAGRARTSPARYHQTPTGALRPGEDRLVTGYLIAVAIRLAETSIPVRAVRAEPDVVAGSIVLDTTAESNDAASRQVTWRVMRLRWEPDTGWAAILSHHDQRRGSDHDALVRYLPANQPVPEPGAVAQFAAAVRADPDTIWASTSPSRPVRADHRLLLMHLARYVPPS